MPDGRVRLVVELNRKQLDALEERGYLYPFERGNRATSARRSRRSSRSRWQDPVARSPMPMSEAIAAVVFDLDGVLVQRGSRFDLARCVVLARQHPGVPREQLAIGFDGPVLSA